MHGHEKDRYTNFKDPLAMMPNTRDLACADVVISLINMEDLERRENQILPFVSCDLEPCSDPSIDPNHLAIVSIQVLELT